MSKSKLVVYNYYKIALLGRIVSVTTTHTGGTFLYYPHLVYRNKDSAELLRVVGNFTNNLVFPASQFIVGRTRSVMQQSAPVSLNKQKELNVAKGFVHTLAVFDDVVVK